ncbi:MAG: hypothetical protein ACJAUW_000585, partial [Yoonia sp.]
MALARTFAYPVAQAFWAFGVGKPLLPRKSPLPEDRQNQDEGEKKRDRFKDHRPNRANAARSSIL